MTNALDCGHAVRAYNHEVNASVSVMQPCRYGMQEKEISSEVEKPCPCPRGSDNVGSAKGSVT